ncbi:DUF5327 family protein [Halalkalibacter akibai]|uniref:Uncharacterized protein n=1 Tax=Halalkalibacter akibai (strain ATCC 43226 / DSM 21942 / CIP 109018 / JCM 9157 / 1139) TaxID=1236973 RepID=W4QQG4_HALA3|nr:DUF5327 family protein [Halalkalibacter akibai]GAE33574.1 hypothetical protein JCM9157_588 [Halalkalibacter akibai JCM 9157]
MEIPAKKICDQLELQVKKLQNAVQGQDQQSMIESVAAIEAYCQLLKSPTVASRPSMPTYTEVTQKEYSMPTTQTITSAEPEVKGRNILEF